MDSREIRVKFRLEGYSNLAASTTYLHGSGNSLACHRDWTEAQMRTVRGLARGFAASGSAITALMQGSNTPRLASTAICGLMLLARLASQGDCTCSGRLSDPKTFEASCSIPIVGYWEIVNEGCNTIEAPEECERVFDYGVRGSACNDLDWTPEFTPLGDRYRLMCWSQRGVPPCSKLVRWFRVVFCTQSQCIDCIERREENGQQREVVTARWCRTRRWALWEWSQYVQPLQIEYCCAFPIPEDVIEPGIGVGL
jgi:hypothetical protein